MARKDLPSVKHALEIRSLPEQVPLAVFDARREQKQIRQKRNALSVDSLIGDHERYWIFSREALSEPLDGSVDAETPKLGSKKYPSVTFSQLTIFAPSFSPFSSVPLLRAIPAREIQVRRL